MMFKFTSTVHFVGATTTFNIVRPFHINNQNSNWIILGLPEVYFYQVFIFLKEFSFLRNQSAGYFFLANTHILS